MFRRYILPLLSIALLALAAVLAESDRRPATPGGVELSTTMIELTSESGAVHLGERIYRNVGHADRLQVQSARPEE
ncbi:hypothetical protein AYO40_02185 [Planctomycetaceae bacterium SCGC AG-212-D15]|nr:hypothetical protein AYO40_02185 [Planctomycetaceae bacterium SCGC AG-212-D15]